jgi:arylsulfatase A-like enzyme
VCPILKEVLARGPARRLSRTERCLAALALAAPVFATALGAGTLACGGSNRAGAAQPDVVIYVVDTLRRDRLGFYGYAGGTSPHLDTLAAEAVVFDDAHAPAPWTLPSVVSLLTSLPPSQHGVLTRGQLLGPQHTPLAERLRELGYGTAAFVANPFAGAAGGLERGYDHVETLRKRIDPGVVEAWLARAPPGPVFLYLHSIEPHRPYKAPARIQQRFGAVTPAQRDRVHAGLRAWRRLARRDAEERDGAQQTIQGSLQRDAALLERLYDAGVAWADENVASLVEMLRRRGSWEHTLFVLVSDHGEEFFEHGALLHDHSLYAELIRIPMLWRLPGAQRGGTRVAAPVTLLDVVPTILDLLGRPELAAGSEGRSLRPWLEDPGRAALPGPRIIAERIHRDPERAGPAVRGDINLGLIEGPWKGIWNVEPDSFELYDASRDPAEARDVASLHPEVVGRLREAARLWLDEHPLPAAAPGQGPATLDPEAVERLRALGYLD